MSSSLLAARAALSELALPCPFCGVAPQVESFEGLPEVVRIACREAGCSIHPMTEFLLLAHGDELLRGWNGRAGPGSERRPMPAIGATRRLSGALGVHWCERC